MNNKTCGECKHHDKYSCLKLKDTVYITSTHLACIRFCPKNPTNGDVIRQMSNEELVGFVDCSACIYAGHDCANQDCTEGKLAWLNAPAQAESEVKDA